MRSRRISQFFVSLVFVCLVLNGCKSRSSRLSASVDSQEGKSAVPRKEPVFAFWDGGLNGESGVQNRLVQGNNIANFLNQSSKEQFEVKLVHMNPAEYDQNYFMEILRPEDFSPEFRRDFLDPVTLSQSMRSLVEGEIQKAEALLSQKFSDKSDLKVKVFRVTQAIMIRAFIASRMTKKDLIQSNTPEFEQFKPTDLDFYKKAAVPLSDFVRLALLNKYGGFWIDTTVTINTNLDFFLTTLKSKNKNLFMYFSLFYHQDPFVYKNQEVRNIGAAETWWLVAPEPNHPLLKAWLEAATSYWIKKVPGQDISMHTMFNKNIKGNKINVNKVPEHLRNYLWIYLAWSKVVLENQQLAEDSVLAWDVFYNPMGLGPSDSYVGPSVWLVYSALEKAGEQLEDWLRIQSEAFFKKEMKIDIAQAINGFLKKNQEDYFKWIDRQLLIKVPGADTADVAKIYNSTDGAITRASVFKYIWEKRLQKD